MTRRWADFNNPQPARWRWIDTFVVVIVSVVCLSAFAAIVALWFLMHPSGTWP